MANRKRDKLSRDFSGVLFEKIRGYKLIFKSFIFTRISYFILKIKGVLIAKKCKFFGTPIVVRAYGSTIEIGEKSTFRSDKTSNLIGVNRRCIISTFNENAKIKIGSNSGFSGTSIGAANSITIGNYVLSGANVLITDFDWHPIDPNFRHTNKNIKNAPVVIHDNVWLGVNSVILKGVTIGENTIIGANSLVVNDIPSNVIAGGNPCKVIKAL